MAETSAVICRTIKSAIENPSKADVVGTVLDDDGGVINFPVRLVNWRGRSMLGIETQSFDPDEWVGNMPTQYYHDSVADKVDIKLLPSYHKYGTVYLNRIQSAVNRLIEAVDNYNVGNHPDISQARKFLQTAFSYYENTIITTIAGKSGLICKNVAGLRVNYSMMTPAAGTHQCNIDEVLIPQTEADEIRARDGHLIMVHREPLLHGLGIVFLKAKILPDTAVDSTRLPWAVFKGMNADCDGDLVFLCNISQYLKKADPTTHTRVVEEINASMRKDRNEHEYSASLCLLNCDAKPQSGDAEDLSSRLDVNVGLSFGPEDLFQPGDDHAFLEIMDAHLGVDPAKILKYARDLTQEEWAADIRDTAKALCYTKRGLGLVGAIGSYCLVLATHYKRALPGAVAIKEGLSQTVLDAKHGEDLDHIDDCLHALMKAGPYEKAPLHQRVEVLVKHGFNKEDMISLFASIGDVGIVTKVYSEFPGFLMATSNSNILSLFHRFTVGDSDKSGPGADAGCWWDQCVKE